MIAHLNHLYCIVSCVCVVLSSIFLSTYCNIALSLHFTLSYKSSFSTGAGTTAAAATIAILWCVIINELTQFSFFYRVIWLSLNQFQFTCHNTMLNFVFVFDFYFALTLFAPVPAGWSVFHLYFFLSFISLSNIRCVIIGFCRVEH